MSFLTQLFQGRKDRDGSAPALEVAATGLPAALLDAALTSVGQDSTDRRRRSIASPQAVLRDALSQKVLHGWLQNRHQTLLPLTVNFRLMDAEKAGLLVSVMSAALLATAVDGMDERAGAVSFLEGAGADEEVLAGFNRALMTPEPLAMLFEKVVRLHELGPLAFILIVVVSDAHEPANQIFVQWAAAKLKLPATVVRSVERRYRQ